jgi:hypothetical protein
MLKTFKTNISDNEFYVQFIVRSFFTYDRISRDKIFWIGFFLFALKCLSINFDAGIVTKIKVKLITTENFLNFFKKWTQIQNFLWIYKIRNLEMLRLWYSISIGIWDLIEKYKSMVYLKYLRIYVFDKNENQFEEFAKHCPHMN